MKKFSSLLLFILFITKVASSQTIAISGTVNDANGNPLHFAFVQDKQLKAAVYTDSLGNFSLAVNPTSRLKVDCYGFKDTLVNIAGQTNFHIVLYPIPTTNSASNANAGSDANRFADQAALSPVGHTITTTQGSMMPQFTIKEETQGSRYLFTSWARGYVINSADSIVQNSNFWFNYDKMGGGLLLSQDRRSAIEVNREQVKSFMLINNNNMAYAFENVTSIDANHYVQVIASGNKYKVYRTLKTKFNKADYSTNGISSSGNNFDSYDDTHEYYLLNLQNNALQKFELKKKSIKGAFANEPEKVNKFMTEHSGDSVNDTYVINLASYLNE